MDQNPTPGPDDRQQPAYTPERVYASRERRLHELVDHAWRVSRGRYNNLPEHIKSVLNMYICTVSSHTPRVGICVWIQKIY